MDLMKAAVLHQSRQVVIKDVPKPAPLAGEVLIRVKSVGICGTDFHYWRTGSVGNFKITEPFILGHEASGQIEQVGEGVTNRSIGEKVVVDIQVPCGKCSICRMGRYNLCPLKRCMGDPPTNGAFAEYVTWPADSAYAMPDDMTFNEGALIEPLNIGVYAVSRAGISMGDSVMIMGAGTVGLMSLHAVLAAGVDEVYVVDIDDWRLNKAREFGATATINARDDVASRVHDLTNGSYVDTTIEASGSPVATVQAVKVTRRGGKIALVGVYDLGEFPYPLLDVVMKELTVFGNIDGANAFPKSMHLMASKKIDAEKLITHHLPLEDLDRAFRILDEKKEHALKIMLHP